MKKTIVLTWIVTAHFLSAFPGSLNADTKTLYETSFADGAKGWSKQDQALVAEHARRKGAKSILIKQWDDKEKDSCWLSPPIANPGKPVTISFWAADNYQKMTDFSYAAVVDAVSFDKDGKEQAATWYLKSIPWDQSRKSDMWGTLRPEGLKWRYYQAVYTPKGDNFRVKFHWRKPIVRGECYLTDLQVKEASPEEIASAKPRSSAKSDSNSDRYKLEISTPVTGNLFYHDDPLQFEVLLWSRNGTPIGKLKNPVLRYTITDFERFDIARGTVPFDNAKAITDSDFIKKNKKRKHNLHQSIVISDEAAKAVGQEFFIEVELVSGGKVIASDTVTYGVVNPRPVDPKLAHQCRFSQHYFMEGVTFNKSKHRNQSISGKSGQVHDHSLDYYWVRNQPKYPGPYTFKTRFSAEHPVSFCPNIEQERSYKEWIKKMVPPECIIDDPLHKGRPTFKIEPYIEYMIAKIKHNRDGIASVVPSGLERPIDARTIELHKKAYTAIKKEFPDLPVGIMLYGLPMNPSKDVDIFIDNDLFDYADFIDTHIYASSVDWTEWKRLQAAYRKRGKTPPPLLSTEFCKVGGSDQVLHARDTITAHMDAFANGMYQVYYFNCCNETKFLEDPFLRGPTDLGGDMTSGFMYMQRVDRPKVSPDMTVEKPKMRWSRAAWGHQYGGDTLMPVLQAMVYYNLVQNFELADFKQVFNPSPATVCYEFERDGQTICCLFLQKPVPTETFVLKTDVPYRLQDFFGRNTAITPVEGISFITVGESPVTLIFDKVVPLHNTKTKQNVFAKVTDGLSVPPVARGAKGSVDIHLPALFKQDLPVKVAATVDGTWPAVKDRTIELKHGTATDLALPFAVRPSRNVGAYPLSVRLYAGTRQFALLQEKLEVRELLQMAISSAPLTKTRNPAIAVTVKSLANKPSTGTVALENLPFSESMKPLTMSKPYTIPAHGQATLTFTINRSLVNLTTSYLVTAQLRDKSGIALQKSEEVAFRATPHTPGKITIDGDLSDWHLDQQVGIPMPRRYRTVNGKDDLDATFYTLWDDDCLYMAAVVKDDSPMSNHNDISIWSEDNIMLGLYPWGWKLGEPLKSGYYREHLGPCKDGQARIFRVGNVAAGPKTAKSCPIAVKKTRDGYIYEWAYPKAAIAPIALKDNGRYRLSLTICDRDYLDPAKQKKSVWHGLQLGSFNTNVDARPDKWREFILTE